MDAKVLRTQNSTFRARPTDKIINWGSSAGLPDVWSEAMLVNDPRWVSVAANKLAFFKRVGGVEPTIIPPFWTDASQIPEDAYPIVCRTVLNGHSGHGIVVANSPSELVRAPLYVQYIKKKDEYRVHVATPDKLIAVQRKARRMDTPDGAVNWMIRNHNNGFVFVRNNVDPPKQVVSIAFAALAVVGLDFGAADVIYRERADRAYVLEVNTAPGLEGQTVQDYADFLRGV